MKTWIKLTEAASLIEIPYDTLHAAHARGVLKTRERSGLEVHVSSLLNYYSAQREVFNRNLVQRGIFNYHDPAHSDRHVSTLDASKVMTRTLILEDVMPRFAAASVEEQEAIAKAIREEFPTCRGLSVQSLRRMKQRYQTLGQIGLRRKKRTDINLPRTSRFEAIKDEFDRVFDRLMASQGKGHRNQYEGANIALNYRMTLQTLARDRGKSLPEVFDNQWMYKEACAVLGIEVPTYKYAYQRAERHGLLKLARKYRLNRPDFEQNAVPLHTWNNWMKYEFLECVQSDGHKFDEKVLVLNEKTGEVKDHIAYGLLWAESKTGVILRFDVHLRTFNARRVGMSMMNLIRDVGRPEVFRFDNGREYINDLITTGVLSLFDVDELNVRPKRITTAHPYKGRQKIPERIFQQLNTYLKDSPGYSGANRIVGPKPTEGTAPVPACRTFEEFVALVNKLVDAFNHEYVEVDLENERIGDLDLVGPGYEMPRLSRNGKVLARRIDLFNAFMKKHIKVEMPDARLIQALGVCEENTVQNGGIHKTFMGDKYFYMPSVVEAEALVAWHGRKIEVRFDPTNESTMAYLYVFDRDTKRYITTVFCDQLKAYTKEQGEEYAKRRRKIVRAIKEFNEEYACVDVLKERLELAIEDRRSMATDAAGKVIKWTPDLSRFNESRMTQDEALTEMELVRAEAMEMEWEYSKEEGGYINYKTGEFSVEDPHQNQ